MNSVILGSKGDDRMNAGGTRQARRIGLRAMALTTVAIGLVGFGVSPGPSTPARAGTEGGPGDVHTAPGKASREDFIREIRRTLKEDDDRLIALAKQVLAEPDAPASLEDQLVNMQIQVKSAEANYRNAQLTREVAEIAVKEYTDGVYPQDLASVEGEIASAKSALDRGRDLIEIAKERQAKIKEVADERTAYGRMINYDYGDRILTAMFEVEKLKLAVEIAQSKKKVLVEYTKEKTSKELESEVKKAHSDELAKQATWEFEKARLEKMQKSGKSPWPASNIGKRLVALLDRAMPIQEQLHVKLDRVAAAPELNERLQKEILGHANDLEALIEEAEAACSESEFAGLKSRLRRATHK